MPDNSTVEALKIWKALEPMVAKKISAMTAGAVQRRKAKVSTAPNATTGLIGVQEAFSNQIMIPYSSQLSEAKVGDMCWIEWSYGATNAIAVPLMQGGTSIEIPVPINKGGTGAEDANGARENLGIPSFPLSVSDGGTGGTTPTTAREGIGAWGKPVVLWTNASPTSTLPTQDIDIDENCPFLLCVGTNGGFILDNTDRGGVLTEAHWTDNYHVTLQTRVIKRAAGGKVRIGNAYGYDYNSNDGKISGKQDNTECILYQIWGIY
nr:MAG TPA: hypothetical protein [Caudoviricetes sp.]